MAVVLYIIDPFPRAAVSYPNRPTSSCPPMAMLPEAVALPVFEIVNIGIPEEDAVRMSSFSSWLNIAKARPVAVEFDTDKWESTITFPKLYVRSVKSEEL